MPKSPAAKPPAPETAQNPSQLDEAALQALLQARHGDPFSVLGMHQVGDALVVRVLLPGAFGVAVVDVRDRKVADLQRQPGTPLFTAVMPRRTSSPNLSPRSPPSPAARPASPSCASATTRPPSPT